MPPRVDVRPQVALVDEKICITASGLRPTQKVTLQAWLKERGLVYSSCGQFVTDQQGCVDTALHSSHGGTYRGADDMGLFWSIQAVPGLSKSKRLIKEDVTTPLVFEINLLNDHVDFGDLRQSTDRIVATAKCERLYKHPDVRRIVVREGPLRGTVFLPAGSGPFPGVIDMFGTGGGLIEFRAALLASHGFATYALPYMTFDDLPESLEELDMNYFLRAVDWFSNQRYVHPGGVGLTSVSKGTELAFILGAYCDKVKAIVSISGPPALAFTDLKKGGQVLVKAVPFVHNAKHTEEGMTLHDCFPEINNRILHAWRNNAKILYLCGSDDGLWNTRELTAVFRQKCPAEKQDNLEIIVYPEAGHLIEPPYMPLCRHSWSKFLGTEILWGGQPKEHAAAQEDAWRRLLDFLHQHLPDRQKPESRL